MSNAYKNFLMVDDYFEITYLIGVVDKIEIIRKYRFATRLNCQCKTKKISGHVDRKDNLLNLNYIDRTQTDKKDYF